MGRRKFEVSDETAYRWCERHRQGDSFRKIALEEGIDRRFIAKVVKEFDRRKYLEEGTAVRREIRADFMREHLEKLEMATRDLLQIVASLSLRRLCELPKDVSISFAKPNIKSELANYIANRLYLQTTEAESIEFTSDLVEEAMTSSADVTRRLLEREAKAIVEDLKAHLPHVWKQVEKWEKIATGYLANWKELDKHVKNKGIPPDLFESGVREGLNFLTKSQTEVESLPQFPTKLETPEDIGLWIYRDATTRKSLEGCRNSYNRLKGAYFQLEGMLIPSELQQALLKEKCPHCPLP